MARPQEDQTMRGQSRIEAFNKTIAAAEARHGKAISEAYRVFNTKHSAAKRSACTARPTWPHIQLRAIKSTPDAEGYEVAREALNCPPFRPDTGISRRA